MMVAKRRLSSDPSDTGDTGPPTKRLRCDPAQRVGADLLSPLSDELLLRILSFLSLEELLAVAPVSRRFDKLAADSQIWKALYYRRFVLPRALRIPGFRHVDPSGGASSGRSHKLHYKGQQALWADGRRGGVVRERTAARSENTTSEGEGRHAANWKRQYKIRHNWARGKCAVEELRVGEDAQQDGRSKRRMLVKVVDGIAFTADQASGLRAWDLKPRKLLAQVALESSERELVPSCMNVDEASIASGLLDIAIGFVDGSFGVWRMDLTQRRLTRRYKHESSSNGELMGIALSFPYVMTATDAVLVSLYTFWCTRKPATSLTTTTQTSGDTAELDLDAGASSGESERENQARSLQTTSGNETRAKDESGTDGLSPPFLVTSLRSHSSRAPLALVIRKMATATIASIAYTFSSRQGWCVGIQDLHLRPASKASLSTPAVTTTRLAYTAPVLSAGSRSGRSAAPAAGSRRSEPGPTSLCYTHPYLLATLPDNTLILYLCTSTASSLSISPGIRLWGHTSGISDAEITARGKAVSVSSQGEEMRVWELEGRSAGLGNHSIEVRPEAISRVVSQDSEEQEGQAVVPNWDERRNWVGFDDEMVIVLKEGRGGRESLMVYDFT